MQAHVERVFMKRAPAVERSIKDIRPDDFRVRIIGVVVGKDATNNSLLLDDGTGRVVATFPDSSRLGDVQEGKRIRVMGKVKPGSIPVIEAEVIQDMSKLDMVLYEQVKSVSEKLGGTV